MEQFFLQPADIYLIDEPSAYLDSEQRIAAAKVIKRFVTPSHTCTHWHYALPFCTHALRFILHAKKTAFVVEHDFIMATYLADRVVVFEGTPSLETHANRYGHSISYFYHPPHHPSLSTTLPTSLLSTTLPTSPLSTILPTILPTSPLSTTLPTSFSTTHPTSFSTTHPTFSLTAQQPYFLV